MRTLKRFLIIGVCITLTLISTPAYALYSPVLSSTVAQIQDHIVSSQAQNGIGSLMEVSQSVVSEYENRRDSGLPSGEPGKAKEARKKLATQASLQALQQPLDGLMMSFNILPSQGGAVISNCLRDDLWALQDLRDVVGQEMVKAYMLSDLIHGDLLSKDYDYLVQHIDLLRRKGNDPNARVEFALSEEGIPLTVRQYLFGTEGEDNYYYGFNFPNEGGCPEGDFEKAFQRVANSAQTVATLSTGQGLAASGAGWGSLWEMAEARAKQRAAEWFAANQISLTLGGGQGGASRSLFKNNGWDQRMAEMQTQLRMLKNLAGPVTAPFDLDIYQNIDGVDFIGGEGRCALYRHETGKYYPCTPAQVENFNKCKLTVDELKQQGQIPANLERGDARDARRDFRKQWNCGRLASTQPEYSVPEAFEQEEQRQLEAIQNYQNELVAFQFNVQFNDIGEETLTEVSDALVSLEGNIRRSVESAGSPEEDPGLPTFAEYLETMANRHCPD